MPITFVQPVAGGPIGAGMIVQWQSDFVGPLPSDTIIDITIRIPGDEAGQVWRERWPTSTPFGFIILGTAPEQASNLVDRFPAIDTTVSVDAVLGTVTTPVDSGSVSAKWQPTLGLGTQAEILSTVTGTGTGGFTETDRNELQATHANTDQEFPVTELSTGDLVVTIASAIITPPPAFLIKKDAVVIFGRGELERPQFGRIVNAYGATWSFITVPEGFGRTFGAVTQYQPRMLQLAVVRKDFGNDEFVAELGDFNTEGQYFIWGLPFPSRIMYDVAPGVVVELRWLVIPQPN